jgi:hypothetical protein
MIDAEGADRARGWLTTVWNHALDATKVARWSSQSRDTGSAGARLARADNVRLKNLTAAAASDAARRASVLSSRV